MEGGKPTIVTNSKGQDFRRGVHQEWRPFGGADQAVVISENTFFSVKRFIGPRSDGVDDKAKQVSCNVLRDSNGNVKLDCPAIGKQFAAEEISALVFITFGSKPSRDFLRCSGSSSIMIPSLCTIRFLKQLLQSPPTSMILSAQPLRMPGVLLESTFSLPLHRLLTVSRRRATKLFSCLILEEELSMFQVSDGVFEALSTSEDTHLSGDDFDKRIVDWLAGNFKKEEGVDLLKDKQACRG